jgi:endonuclease YncB( thermonuclease family)
MRKIFRAMMLTALTIAAMYYVALNADAPGPARKGCVIAAVPSGDSLSLKCNGAGEMRYRIEGLDAPNIEKPGCAEELAHGTLAAERLQGLLKSGAVQIERLAGDTTPPWVRVSVDGTDVAEQLIREGLAVAYAGGARINWCERLGAQ